MVKEDKGKGGLSVLIAIVYDHSGATIHVEYVHTNILKRKQMLSFLLDLALIRPPVWLVDKFTHLTYMYI